MKKLLYIGLVLLLCSAGCKVNYSFTGASIPDNVKTVSVEYFENQTPLTNPNFPQIITEALRDKFIRQTRLKLVARDGDVQFKGYITAYGTAPLAITTDAAALTRLTITVAVVYENKVDETQDFNQSFTRFADFNASQSLSSVEDALMTEITNQLVQDIFNRAFLNW